MKNKSPKNITVLSVVLLNTLAILGLRWLAFAGKFGAASVLIWVMAALLFFIPATFICAEFGAAYPDKEAAITDWVKAELGEGCAFFASWFYCIAMLFFISTMLAFVGIGVAYAIDPQWAQSKLFIISFVIITFWAMLLLSTKSIEIFKKTNEIACFLGVLLPIILLVAAAVINVFILKSNVPTDFSPGKWIPNLSLNNIFFLVGVSSAFGGTEISAPFITRMKNPRRNFPLAIFIATALIIICYVVGTFSLIAIISPSNLNTSSGIFEVLTSVFSKVHLEFITKIVFVLMAIGMLAGSVLWLTSPAKMLIDGNDPSIFPAFMVKKTADGLPLNTMILQGIFITFLILLSDLFSTVDAIYNVLVMAAAILMFLAYIFLLLAFIKMKFRKDQQVLFKIASKKPVAVIIFILAFFTCITSIIVPIISIPSGANTLLYELEIVGVPVMLAFLGFLLYRRKRKSDV